MKQKRVLAIIPARGGSKGIKNKNLVPLNGKPLIAWTIEQAQRSSLIDEIFVTTDSEAIKSVADNYGNYCNWLRPSSLATDESRTIDCVLHVMQQYKDKKNEAFEYICLLEPTSPLRDHDLIDKMLTKLFESEADSIVSVGKNKMHPSIIKKLDSNGYLSPYEKNAPLDIRRQDLTSLYHPFGTFVVKSAILEECQSFYPKKQIPYILSEELCFEIDETIDLICIEGIMKHYGFQ